MQIVIDIPEEEHHYIQLYGIIKPFSGNFIAKLIKNGTVLPKGHGRLIDESQIIECGLDFINHKIKTDAPTIIEADKEVERGA